MIEEITALRQEAESFDIHDTATLENFRLHFLSRKGKLNDLFEKFKEHRGDDKRELGQAINGLKQFLQERLDNGLSSFQKVAIAHTQEDLTRPSGAFPLGHRHPISQIREEIIRIFRNIGFAVEDGPEIEDDWHVFSGLNFAADHPARDMQDTFFVKDAVDSNGQPLLLRTHTSSVQVRVMENSKPPIRIIMPGRVYRNEAISARAHCQFHQIEGLYIDKDVTFADMKQTLQHFTQTFFGKSEIRLRPSYFPFTEPSAEMDVYWGLETPADHRITKGTGWLEIMGCGMVDPAVLQASGIDPEQYSGFAFGMGLERIAMLRYQIDDLRHFFENDYRFLNQF
ncbi:MAG: phenylalanine--tRNA ligase subunit alpha [Flavobacteriales bacterium]